MKRLLALVFLVPLLAPAQMLQQIVQGTSGFQTYSDDFNRANGDLGPNWQKSLATGPNAVGALTIVSNAVMAAVVPMLHSQAVYKAGSFGNNQWTSFTIQSGNGGISAGQEAVVRANGLDFYNDAVAAGSSMGGLVLYRIGNAASVDFCGSIPMADYAIGDRHTLNVAGTGPVWFWAMRTPSGSTVPTINAACVDVTDNIVGGIPGLGEDDNNSTPTLISDNWQGGSLPSFSTVPSDNFQRDDAGWLGVNWGFDPTGQCTGSPGSYMLLSNHAAINQKAGQQSVAIWTTPFAAGANQASVIQIGNFHTGDFVGPVVRYSPGTICNESYYFALLSGGSAQLYKYTSNAQTNLTTFGTFGGTPTSMELDATGTNPVTLTLKINGTVIGSPYVDSTYHLAGTYEGFTMFGTNLTTITGWTGN